MTTPPSKSQIDRLGERLRGSEKPSEADLAELQRWIQGHDPVLGETARTVREELGLAPTSRLKTAGTILDKLRRQSVRLSQIQDVAGLRLVEDWTLAEQDDCAGRLTRAFPVSRLVDRRANPTHGYRAVHLIVVIDGYQVEIQIRTRLQHLWAEVIERVSDVWGRGIRYGEEPEDPDVLDMNVIPGSTRASAALGLMDAAKMVSSIEEIRQQEAIRVREGVRPSEMQRSPTDGIEADVRETFEGALRRLGGARMEGS